jgi:hypothetical protein
MYHGQPPKMYRISCIMYDDIYHHLLSSIMIYGDTVIQIMIYDMIYRMIYCMIPYDIRDVVCVSTQNFRSFGFLCVE